MKKISIFIVLLIIISAIFYFWNKNIAVYNDDIEATPQTWYLSFQFSEDDSISKEFINTEATSLYDITNLIAQAEGWQFESEDYGDMGILVIQIGDKINGQDQKYWQYFVDSEQPQISVDKYMPAGGTLIEWKFIKSEF